MIPRRIHYCWFGNSPKPPYFQRCLASWRRHFKGFEIVEWNETNIALDHPFLIKAYNDKKWAFVSDYVRIKKLKELGGIYLDSDMYFIKSIPDSILTSYTSFIGAQSKQLLNAAIIGSMPESEFINRVYEFYHNLEYVNPYDITIPIMVTNLFPEVVRPIVSDQIHQWGIVFEPSVFYPLPHKLRSFHWNRFVTNRTMAVHLWAGSWMEIDNHNILGIVKAKVKYTISKWYVPKSILEYARNT